MGRMTGFEPATTGTTNRCSNQLSYIRHTVGTAVPEIFSARLHLRYGAALNFATTRSVDKIGGADRTRTDDPLHAMQVLYQLSYNPKARLILYFFLLNVNLIC